MQPLFLLRNLPLSCLSCICMLLSSRLSFDFRPLSDSPTATLLYSPSVLFQMLLSDDFFFTFQSYVLLFSLMSRHTLELFPLPTAFFPPFEWLMPSSFSWFHIGIGMSLFTFWGSPPHCCLPPLPLVPCSSPPSCNQGYQPKIYFFFFTDNWQTFYWQLN